MAFIKKLILLHAVVLLSFFDVSLLLYAQEIRILKVLVVIDPNFATQLKIDPDAWAKEQISQVNQLYTVLASGRQIQFEVKNTRIESYKNIPLKKKYFKWMKNKVDVESNDYNAMRMKSVKQDFSKQRLTDHGYDILLFFDYSSRHHQIDSKTSAMAEAMGNYAVFYAGEGFYGNKNLTRVIAHELGHLLGLQHTNNDGIMRPHKAGEHFSALSLNILDLFFDRDYSRGIEQFSIKVMEDYLDTLIVSNDLYYSVWSAYGVEHFQCLYFKTYIKTLFKDNIEEDRICVKNEASNQYEISFSIQSNFPSLGYDQGLDFIYNKLILNDSSKPLEALFYRLFPPFHMPWLDELNFRKKIIESYEKEYIENPSNVNEINGYLEEHKDMLYKTFKNNYLSKYLFNVLEQYFVVQKKLAENLLEDEKNQLLSEINLFEQEVEDRKIVFYQDLNQRIAKLKAIDENQLTNKDLAKLAYYYWLKGETKIIYYQSMKL